MTKLLLLGLALLACLGGCRSLPPPAPPAPAITSAAELLTQLQGRQQGLTSFAAKGRLTFLSPQQNYSGTGLLKGHLPTTFRADVLDILGRSLLSFYSDGQEVQVFSPKEGKLYVGQATPGNLAAFIPPALTLPQTLRLLVGDLPLNQGPPAHWSFDAQSGRYQLEWHYPQGAVQERLWVESQGLHPVQDEWYEPDGQTRFTVSLRDYGRLAPHLPGQIVLNTRLPQVELRLAYREMQINPALEPATLRLPRMPDVTEVPLKP